MKKLFELVYFFMFCVPLAAVVYVSVVIMFAIIDLKNFITIEFHHHDKKRQHS